MSSLVSRRLSILAIGLIVASSGLSLAAQSQPASPAPAPVVAEQPLPSTAKPTFKVDTRLTVEDVTVTDAQSKPVHGLERTDFTIKEDGKPQPIRDFEEYGIEKAAQSPPADLPANTYTNAQPPSTGAVNVLLLDSVTTGVINGLIMAPENVQYARQQAIKYLQRMPPGTRVAILEMGNVLRVVQGVTTDRAILLAAMNAVSFEPAAGAYVHPYPSAEDYCIAANTQSRLVVDGLEQTAAFLAGINGRKNLIWFTPGIYWLTNSYELITVRCHAYHNDERMSIDEGLDNHTEQLHRIYGLFNAEQVVLYPVDPRGLAARPSGTFLGKPVDDKLSLLEMANATGGVAFFNRNDLDSAIEQAIATGTDYYSLSYVPPLTKHDGQYHKIDVKVDRPKLSLQYRPGYTAVDLTKAPKSSKAEPPQPSAIDVAMVHGATPSSQLLFNVRVTPSTAPAKPADPIVIGSLNPKLKGKLIRYDFLFSLSGDQLALVDGPDGTRKASIKLFIAAYDADGKVLNYLGQSGKWTIKPEQVAQFSRQSLLVPMQIDLPSGNIFIRLGVLDVASQKMGTLEIPETVAK